MADPQVWPNAWDTSTPTHMYFENQVSCTAPGAFSELRTHTADRRLTLVLHSQVAALCGLHCLNTLLQGPCFGEFDLAQVCVAALHRCCLAPLLVLVCSLEVRDESAVATCPDDHNILSLDSR